MPWTWLMSNTNPRFLVAMMNKLNQSQPLRLANGYRFQWEPAQDSHVLLYPEGMVKLNQTAALILSKVDNERNLAQIKANLSRQFPDADIDEDVELFVSTAIEKRWLEPL